MKLTYCAIFTPCECISGYTVTVPDLPGCVTEGATVAEAIRMAQDTASRWLLDELEEGNPVPASSPSSMFHLEAGEFVKLLVLDTDIHTEAPPVMLDPLLKQKLMEGKETPLDECISEDQVNW